MPTGTGRPLTFCVCRFRDEKTLTAERERLTEANVTARLVVREGMAHAWPGWEKDGELIAAWFDAHLLPGSGR